jgi:hypothetical protein
MYGTQFGKANSKQNSKFHGQGELGTQKRVITIEVARRGRERNEIHRIENARVKAWVVNTQEREERM